MIRPILIFHLQTAIAALSQAIAEERGVYGKNGYVAELEVYQEVMSETLARARERLKEEMENGEG